MLLKSKIHYLGRGKGPRLHDLRHSFCCHALKKMSDKGIDLYVSLPYLSAYVGHKNITATERYVRLTEDFFSDVLKKTSELSKYIYPRDYNNDTN
jgi:integrase